MKVVVVAAVAFVIGLLLGVILSDVVNPTFQPHAPYGASTTQGN